MMKLVEKSNKGEHSGKMGKIMEYSKGGLEEPEIYRFSTAVKRGKLYICHTIFTKTGHYSCHIYMMRSTDNSPVALQIPPLCFYETGFPSKDLNQYN